MRRVTRSPYRQVMLPGPVRASERALAPDLAQGFMLLLIVVSNTGFHLYAAEYRQGWHPVDGSTADRVVQFLVITTLDMKIYPLFSFLLGYGMMQLYLRRTGAGTESPIADLATGEPDVLAAVGRRFLTWLFLVGAGAIGWIVSPQILLGFWAAL